MTEISDNVAELEHGVTCAHEQMENGERRFRLRKCDGTAYIRTESSKFGGWQSSHYHSSVRESYIVQEGWMGFAELIDGRLSLKIYSENELVTSRPMVVHNVYLPSDAVIHTIKHGRANGADWLTGPETLAFDKVTKALISEVDVKACAMQQTPTRPEYGDTYRHFDNLIWQVPAWSTAVFAFSIQAISQIYSTPLSQSHLIVPTVATVSSICLFCFALVLARFRVHQRAFKSRKNTRWWHSGTTAIQALVFAEAVILLAIAAIALGVGLKWVVMLVVFACLALSLLTERLVRR